MLQFLEILADRGTARAMAPTWADANQRVTGLFYAHWDSPLGKEKAPAFALGPRRGGLEAGVVVGRGHLRGLPRLRNGPDLLDRLRVTRATRPTGVATGRSRARGVHHRVDRGSHGQYDLAEADAFGLEGVALGGEGFRLGDGTCELVLVAGLVHDGIVASGPMEPLLFVQFIGGLSETFLQAPVVLLEGGDPLLLDADLLVAVLEVVDRGFDNGPHLAHGVGQDAVHLGEGLLDAGEGIEDVLGVHGHGFLVRV